jgi:CRP-like cAMP-binding protein
MLRRLSRRKPSSTPLALEIQESKLSLLCEADIFQGLSPVDMQEIERMTTMTTARKGRIIYSPGSSGEVLFILKKGRVQLYRLAEDGRRFVTAILEGGSIFGEMPMLSQRMAGSTAEALEDCTLCVMSKSDVEHLIASKPSVALNVVHLLATRNAELEEKLERQAFQSVHERLAAILLRLAESGDEIKDVSHQQIGETIGASRETVTRALGDFRGQGLIEIGRSRVSILNRRGLESLAHTESSQ